MAITVRGSALAYINNSATGTISLPAGAVAGDYCVLFVDHGWPIVIREPESRWRTIDISTGNNANGAALECVLTATQVTAGSVSFGFTNPAYGTMVMVAFIGALSGFRTFIAQRSSTGATTRTLTTDTTPVINDYALYFGSGRFNGTITNSVGGALQTSSNFNASTVVTGRLLAAGGADTSTFTFSATPNGDYEIIVIVAETPKTGLQLRAPLVTVDPLSEGNPALRASLVTVDPLSEGSPSLRSSFVTVDPLNEGYPNLRMSLLVVEVLQPVAPGGTVSTQLFPGSLGSTTPMIGLAFAFHKRPRFATQMQQAASGVSVRNALMQYPIWEFEANFEFLRSDVTAEYQTMLGFILSRQGGFDTFLYKDTDDYLVTNGTLGTADGLTTQFSFKRTMGGFAEKIGQVDNAATITIYGTIAQTSSVPATPGPYTITVTNSATFVADLGVTKAGVPLTAVGGAPAAGQYSVAAGVYTFNAAEQAASVIITYRYSFAPAAYTITLPNLVVFNVAPANTTIISADFQFYFNCRFSEDVFDLSKFAAQFWELQSLPFESVPQ